MPLNLPLKLCFSELLPKRSPGTGAHGAEGSSSAYPPPGIDVGDVHQGVILLQGLIFVEDFHLAQGTASVPRHGGRGTATPPEPLIRALPSPEPPSQSQELPGLLALPLPEAGASSELTCNAP